ncbi:MAG: hypothetical protein WKF77_00785 [Planctomycetaceae bacterium]
MPTSSQELQSFQQYATARLQNGGALLELDQLFDEWRNLNPDPKQLSEDAIAVRASLRDIERGETGLPVEDAVREIRAKYNLASEL